MKPKKETDVQDIKETEITKYYAVGGKTICFRFQNVFTGMVDGKKEMLDEVLIDNMVGQMAKAIKSNCSRYNPIPEEIIIGSRGSREISNKENQEKPKEPERDIIESYEPRFSLEEQKSGQPFQRSGIERRCPRNGECLSISLEAGLSS